MKSHPGGMEHTRRMLALAALPEGARVLDMGAGAGESVQLMRSLGLDAVGIDLEASFDAVLSQCAFFVSGDRAGALREARRLLRPGGLLLLSDVFFEEPTALLRAAGFEILKAEDMTHGWREYYLEALWRGEDCGCELPRGRCCYWLLIGRKD